MGAESLDVLFTARPPYARQAGPKTTYTDEALIGQIRQVLAASPFLGEGHRKVWARLRAQGIRTSKPGCCGSCARLGAASPRRHARIKVG